MHRLSRYIFKQLFLTVLTVTIVLTTIMWLVQSIRYIDFIANKGASLGLFFEIILYLLPNLFVIIAPIAVLIGVLFVYNKLIADHEFAVMQSAGLGYWQLAKPAFSIGILFTLLIYVCSLYLLPLSFRKYRDIALSLKEKSLTSLLQVGQFNTFGRYTVYSKAQDAQGNFLGLLIYDGSPGESPTIFMAEKGIVLKEGDEGRLHLVNGNRQEKDLMTGKPSLLYFDRYTIEAKEKEGNVGQSDRFMKAYERSVDNLLHPEENLSQNTKLEFLSAAHGRLLSPLYALAFSLLGACFMILGYFNRHGRLWRLLIPCFIASLIEVIAMIFLHTLNHAYLMIGLSYGIVMFTIMFCLFLLTPWGVATMTFRRAS